MFALLLACATSTESAPPDTEAPLVIPATLPFEVLTYRQGEQGLTYALQRTDPPIGLQGVFCDQGEVNCHSCAVEWRIGTAGEELDRALAYCEAEPGQGGRWTIIAWYAPE